MNDFYSEIYPWTISLRDSPEAYDCVLYSLSEDSSATGASNKRQETARAATAQVSPGVRNDAEDRWMLEIYERQVDERNDRN